MVDFDRLTKSKKARPSSYLALQSPSSLHYQIQCFSFTKGAGRVAKLDIAEVHPIHRK